MGCYQRIAATMALMCVAGMAPRNAWALEAPASADGRIADIVAQLGSPNFEEREWATRMLIEEGESALDVLSGAYAAVDDLEVRSRLQEIVKGIVFREPMAQLGGFLGINPQLVGSDVCPMQETSRQACEQALPPNQQAIRVQAVVPDTAADQADLEQGDLIIELNGESFDASFTQKTFMDSIRQMPPGTQVQLTVLRGDELLAKMVQLGVRPLHKLANTELDSLQRQGLRDAARIFGEWCAQAERDATSRSKSPTN